jgi:hypothetical protein
MKGRRRKRYLPPLSKKSSAEAGVELLAFLASVMAGGE